VIRRFLLGFLVVGVVLLLAVQLVPYGRSHDNPPVATDPAWDSPRTRELAVATCYDCHSNVTEWPWYSEIAPLSWLVQRDVDEGREKLNFSESGGGEEAGEAAETVRDGEMPPFSYTLTHPGARLSDAERAELISGLTATFGGGEGDEGDDD
jgi:mono/diheme cytochrome c family protein